jgi:uncharacterized membrane protein
VIKTVTYRMIVTGLDFTTNVLVPGDAGIAAGLSSIPLIAGPIFYFVHETAWNYWGGPVSREGGRRGTAVELPIPLLWRTEPKAAAGEPRRVAINRSLAKTITFRTLASTMDFTANYLVVGDLATAVGLTAVGFVLGPFVYLGHEMAWERIGVGEDWRGRGLAWERIGVSSPPTRWRPRQSRDPQPGAGAFSRVPARL